MAEQACGREEEQPPALHPQARFGAVGRGEESRDLFIAVQIREPVIGGAGIVPPVPAPFLLDSNSSLNSWIKRSSA
jgi:hypothetical protein